MLGHRLFLFYGGSGMEMKRIQEYSSKTSLAMANVYHSVMKVYPNCISDINSDKDYYLGVKQATLISPALLAFLGENGFHFHTLDKASHKGRGIDFQLKNPLTGKAMTGSSSGTALNVFLGINDIGIGTDGGGSVLSPAATLNLIGMIHPAFGANWVDFQMYKKVSTDNIVFTPSIGFISRKLQLVEEVATLFVETEMEKNEVKVAIDADIEKEKWASWKIAADIRSRNFAYKYEASREELIDEVEALFTEVDIIVSKEGPIDVDGMGETLFGHFDTQTRATQVQGKKGFVRVINMCNAMGLIVPVGELATGYLIIARPQHGLEKKVFQLAELLIAKEDPLVANYFLDHHAYFEEGYSS